MKRENEPPRQFLASLAVTLIGIALPVLVASWTYWDTQRSQSADESYARREVRYQKLVASVDAFRAGQKQLNCEGKQSFVRELQQCWLYCSDEAIRAAKAWLDMAKPGRTETNDDRLAALGELMLILRKDLLSREPVPRETSLRASEFELLYAMECEATDTEGALPTPGAK